MLTLLAVARLFYPRPQDPERRSRPGDHLRAAPSVLGYLAGAALVAAGFADFPADRLTTSSRRHRAPHAHAGLLRGGHGGERHRLADLGRLFDRVGIGILVPLTLVAAAYAPLVFLGGFWPSLAGCHCGASAWASTSRSSRRQWRRWSPPDRRASAYGLFTGAYGTAWLLGSIVIGLLFNISLGPVGGVRVPAELTAIPLILRAAGTAPAKKGHMTVSSLEGAGTHRVAHVDALEILDSRGRPTLEVFVSRLENGTPARPGFHRARLPGAGKRWNSGTGT